MGFQPGITNKQSQLAARMGHSLTVYVQVKGLFFQLA